MGIEPRKWTLRQYSIQRLSNTKIWRIWTMLIRLHKNNNLEIMLVANSYKLKQEKKMYHQCDFVVIFFFFILHSIHFFLCFAIYFLLLLLMYFILSCIYYSFCCVY